MTGIQHSGHRVAGEHFTALDTASRIQPATNFPAIIQVCATLQRSFANLNADDDVQVQAISDAVRI